MAIKEIKSKINDNKQEKERKLLNTALHLFSEKGIKKLLFKILLKMQVLLKELHFIYFQKKELKNFYSRYC
ncbi:hypothetical protein [Faecalibacillus intestinalis]|uniref:hypothetical protein n=1 Tax=Faecalibacillus intestinalis TaxID=1982626 RepID=UPI002FD88EFA